MYRILLQGHLGVKTYRPHPTKPMSHLKPARRSNKKLTKPEVSLKNPKRKLGKPEVRRKKPTRKGNSNRQLNIGLSTHLPTIPTIKSINSEVSTFPSILKSKEECEELFEECVFSDIKLQDGYREDRII